LFLDNNGMPYPTFEAYTSSTHQKFRLVDHAAKPTPHKHNQEDLVSF